jgi:hypothetical protein
MIVFSRLKQLAALLVLVVAIQPAGGSLGISATASSADQTNQVESLSASQASGHSSPSEDSTDAGHRTVVHKRDDWVRTRNGWERETKWPGPLVVYQPALHPAVVAALIGLAALWALIAFPVEDAAGSDEV